MSAHTEDEWKVTIRGGSYEVYEVETGPVASIEEAHARARAIGRTRELMAVLRNLAKTVAYANDNQHAGLNVSSAVWAQLYEETHMARALLKEIDN